MYTAINSKGIKVRAKEANRGEDYYCPLCNTKLIYKAGKYNAHHFAHENKKSCDSWNNEMSLWHTLWQDLFPIDNIEVPITVDDKTHIADVKIGDKIIEFQHSNISYEEMVEGISFILSQANLIWVIDGIGKRFYMIADPRERYINRINVETELDCSKEKQYYWSYQNKAIRDIDWDNNLQLYIHVNENYLINVTKMSWGQFMGIGIKTEDFIRSLSSEVVYKNNFRISEHNRRENDVKYYKKTIRNKMTVDLNK